MKLQEIMQEGVFDSVNVERSKTDLTNLARYHTPRQLNATLKELSDEEFQDLYADVRTRYIQYQRINRRTDEKIKELESQHKDEVKRTYSSTTPPGWVRFEFPRTETRYGGATTASVIVKRGTPQVDAVEKLLKQHNHYERIRAEASLSYNFQKEDESRKKAAKKAANKVSVGKFDEWAQMSPILNDVEVPDLLSKHSSKEASLKNPVTYPNATEIFIGHPAKFPNWTPNWKRRLLAIEDALIRNGKKGLQLMYSARINKGAQKQPRGYFNFYIIGADGDFVWRKYQTSGANGGNWLYMDHVETGRMMTTDFESKTKKEQDKIIKQI